MRTADATDPVRRKVYLADSRRLASWGNNPMITGALESVVHSVEELVKWVEVELLDGERASQLAGRSQIGSVKLV